MRPNSIQSALEALYEAVNGFADGGTVHNDMLTLPYSGAPNSVQSGLGDTSGGLGPQAQSAPDLSHGMLDQQFSGLVLNPAGPGPAPGQNSRVGDPTDPNWWNTYGFGPEQQFVDYSKIPDPPPLQEAPASNTGNSGGAAGLVGAGGLMDYLQGARNIRNLYNRVNTSLNPAPNISSSMPNQTNLTTSPLGDPEVAAPDVTINDDGTVTPNNTGTSGLGASTGVGLGAGLAGGLASAAAPAGTVAVSELGADAGAGLAGAAGTEAGTAAGTGLAGSAGAAGAGSGLGASIAASGAMQAIPIAGAAWALADWANANMHNDADHQVAQWLPGQLGLGAAGAGHGGLQGYAMPGGGFMTNGDYTDMVDAIVNHRYQGAADIYGRDMSNTTSHGNLSDDYFNSIVKNLAPPKTDLWTMLGLHHP